MTTSQSEKKKHKKNKYKIEFNYINLSLQDNKNIKKMKYLIVK